jgi:hypothetical protein
VNWPRERSLQLDSSTRQLDSARKIKRFKARVRPIPGLHGLRTPQVLYPATRGARVFLSRPPHKHRRKAHFAADTGRFPIHRRRAFLCYSRLPAAHGKRRERNSLSASLFLPASRAHREVPNTRRPGSTKGVLFGVVGFFLNEPSSEQRGQTTDTTSSRFFSSSLSLSLSLSPKARIHARLFKG